MDLVALGRAPAWSAVEVANLGGLCRGSLLRDWAAHVARHWGPDGVARVRSRTGIDAVRLPDAPVREGWYPVWFQLALTRAIGDEFVGGDLLALEPLIREDAARTPDRWIERVVRLALTPQRILRATPKVYGALYDRGRADAEVGAHEATVRWREAAFMSEPTWRTMQAFAVRAMFTTLKRTAPTITAFDAGPGTFGLTARWD
jgi:hypothetical protein